jgi:peptidoglycan hydrolase-like protein with peptidoglycan-binding domain
VVLPVPVPVPVSARDVFGGRDVAGFPLDIGQFPGRPTITPAGRPLTPAQATGQYDFVTDVPVQGPTDEGLRAASCWYAQNMTPQTPPCAPRADCTGPIPQWTRRNLYFGPRPSGGDQYANRGGGPIVPSGIGGIAETGIQDLSHDRSAVWAAQQQLNRLGERLRLDGDFGANTAGAIARFQLAHGMSPTGRLDTITSTLIDLAAMTGGAGRPSGFGIVGDKETTMFLGESISLGGCGCRGFALDGPGDPDAFAGLTPDQQTWIRNSLATFNSQITSATGTSCPTWVDPGVNLQAAVACFQIWVNNAKLPTITAGITTTPLRTDGVLDQDTLTALQNTTHVYAQDFPNAFPAGGNAPAPPIPAPVPATPAPSATLAPAPTPAPTPAPVTTTTPAPAATATKHGLSTGAIVGIGVAGAVVVGGVIYFATHGGGGGKGSRGGRRRKRSR